MKNVAIIETSAVSIELFGNKKIDRAGERRPIDFDRQLDSFFMGPGQAEVPSRVALFGFRSSERS